MGRSVDRVGVTVPGFNVNGKGAGATNLVETSRKHRFIVRLFNPLSTDLLFFAHKVTLPAVEIDRIVMHHKQEEIYLPGKHRYQQCEIGFYRAHDSDGDRAAREIYKWWSQSVVRVDESTLAADDSGSFIKRNAEIHVLDGSGGTSYRYLLMGIWSQKISPESLDFSDSNVADITITLQVDKVKELPGRSPMAAAGDPCNARPDAVGGFTAGAPRRPGSLQSMFPGSPPTPAGRVGPFSP